MATVAKQIDEAAIMAVLDRVPDPEIPALTITDLGIVVTSSNCTAAATAPSPNSSLLRDRSPVRSRVGTSSFASSASIEWLLAQSGDDPNMGARPLRRD